MRRLMALVLLVMVLALPGRAAATTTTLEPLPDGCTGTALARPDCGTKPVSSGDRGGAAQVALFFIVAAGMATVLVVVIRASNRRTAAQG